MEQTKERIFSYDVIRAIACLCVLTIHFNTSFSAWTEGVFTYSNSVFPSYIFNQIYAAGNKPQNHPHLRIRRFSVLVQTCGTVGISQLEDDLLAAEKVVEKTFVQWDLLQTTKIQKL